MLVVDLPGLVIVIILIARTYGGGIADESEFEASGSTANGTSRRPISWSSANYRTGEWAEVDKDPRRMGSRVELLRSHPHIFPSCLALLHILESTDAGRATLQALREPLTRLQSLQRVVLQHDLDLQTLRRPPADRGWEPYLALGLRPRGEDSPQSRSGTAPEHRGGVSAASQTAPAAADEFVAASSAHVVEPQKAGGVSASAATAAAAASANAAEAPTAADKSEAAVSGAAAVARGTAVSELASAGAASGGTGAAAAAAVAAATAAAEAATAAASLATALAEAATSGRTLQSAGDGEALGTTDGGGLSSGRRTVEGQEPADGSVDRAGQKLGPYLRFAEKVLRGEADRAAMKEELRARRRRGQREAEALEPLVQGLLERLRELLRAAARNTTGMSTSSTAVAAASDPTAMSYSKTTDTTDAPTADPDDLELYDLLLLPCTQAHLEPANYPSFPPRPVVSFVLPYSGRRMRPTLDLFVEPLIQCVAGGAEDGGAAEGDGVGDSRSGARVSGSRSDGDGGKSQAGFEVAFELLVAFDDPSEAPAWAAVAAESGGRVVPVFRPGGVQMTEAAASATAADAAGAAAEGTRGGVSAGDGLGASGAGGSASIVSWRRMWAAVQRLAAMAQGDLLVLLRDGDALPSRPCSWLRQAVRAFDVWPKLGLAGSGPFVLDWHPDPNSLNRGLFFWDSANQLPLQFVTAVMQPPLPASERPGTGVGAGGGEAGVGIGGDGGGGGSLMAVRRTAWEQLGGLDEALGGAATCGPCAGLDLSTRMWLGGWQVAYIQPSGAEPPSPQPPHPPASSSPVARLVLTAGGLRMDGGTESSVPAGPSGPQSGSSNSRDNSADSDGAAGMGGGSPSGSGQEALRRDGLRRQIRSERGPERGGSGPGSGGNLNADGGSREADQAGKGNGNGTLEDAAWCLRGGPGQRQRLEAVCVRLLGFRYGQSPYASAATAAAGEGARGSSGANVNTVGAGAGNPAPGVGSGTGFGGSEIHARITEHVRRLNLGRLQRRHVHAGASASAAGPAPVGLGVAAAAAAAA